MATDLFELASRKKYRFSTPRGAAANVEDLWTLPMKEINATYVAYVKSRRNVVEDLEGGDALDPDLENVIAILKHVYEVRKGEAAAATAKASRSQEVARLRELLAQKKNETLASKSEDELEALIKNLEA